MLPALLILLAAAQDIVVKQAELTLEDPTLSSLTFDPALESASQVRAERLRMEPGARITYPTGGKVANHTVSADLHLAGALVLRNDNRWTHEAHMLRIDGALHGAGPLVVQGDGDGGVQLLRDSTASFDGDVRIESGMLIPRVPGAIGPASTRVTHSGGKLFLPGIVFPHALDVVGDAVLWIGGTTRLTGAVNVSAGVTWTVNTGGGNATTLSGGLTGAGKLRVLAGTSHRAAPLTLALAAPFAGAVSVEQGALQLASEGEALLGNVRLGGSAAPTSLRWSSSDQLGDDVVLEVAGPGTTTLQLRGNAEALARVEVQGELLLALGEGSDHLQVRAPSSAPWTGTVILEGWTPKDRVQWAGAELARVGFRTQPGEFPPLRHAALDDDGRLVPGAPLALPDSLPFAIDPAADAARRELYEVRGLEALTAASPGEDVTISFFGDSITWLGGYVGQVEKAVAGSGARVRNRGINGGGVRELRDGSPGSARAGGRTSGDGNAPQAPFAEILAEDHTSVAVVLIGINDVNWRGTTAEQFEGALRELCATARTAGARVVLATLLLDGELPDGTNPDDAKIERFAQLTRQVAQAENAVLVDLRAAALAWLRNHNRKLRLDGTLEHRTQGLLTYDRIHLSAVGNELVAELLAAGIVKALAR